MGRHSRRGAADKPDTGSAPVAPQQAPGPGSGRRRAAAAGADRAGQERRTRPAPTATDALRPHPEHHEQGGAWGDLGAGGYVPPAATTVAQPRIPGPRHDYVAAFGGLGELDSDTDDVFAAGAPPKQPTDPYGTVTDRDHEAEGDGLREAEAGQPDAERAKGGRGRGFVGIAAAAVTTVLAVGVAVQIADGHADDAPAGAAEAGAGAREQAEDASRSAERRPPSKPGAAPATYAQKMGKKYPLAADLKASGEFQAIGGFDEAPGKGQKFRYRVDVEKGLGLDGELFAEAVQKTLNDDRSWAHGGGRTFERISSGSADFVITLASPGTTGVWCAKSGLDTTEDNVSCDSAATERVMINAYRWAQGAKTYGDAIHSYRQMLINHEVGHRLGFNHVMCSADGALAPVMQQQTKFLEYDGVKCRPNPWAFPGN